MKRYQAAMRHPLVSVITHPTNRIETVTDPGTSAHRMYRVVTPRQP